MRDTPLERKWEWRISFLGVVFDSCKNWVPRRAKAFTYHRSGKVSSTGELIDLNPPGDEEAVSRSEGPKYGNFAGR
jgi:hypothetical protein